MATHFSLQVHEPIYSKSFGSKCKRRNKANVPNLSKLSWRELGKSPFLKNRMSLESLFSRRRFSCCVPSRALSSTSVSDSSEGTNSENESAIIKADEKIEEFNRVNCLVWVLHESARSFSLSIESLELPGIGPELAMAWNGKDVHQWHRRIAYKVAVYALLKTVIEVETLLSHDRQNNPSPVKEILTPKINLMGDYIESQLSTKSPDLVHCFRKDIFPCIAGYFIPLLKKWTMEYAGSGVAGIVIAISCCVAIGKLGPGRFSCPLFTLSIEDILEELMDLSHSLVAVDKLHQLAIDAGFEHNFLSHFGAQVLNFDDTEELEFWIGLAHQKLSAAFQKEIIVKDAGTLDKKVHADSIATLGLFAYLGRKTRLYLSNMGIEDHDELIRDFLSYLECGSLFIFPELSSVSAYQCFMEVVTDEIGWLEFYNQCYLNNQERKRSKQRKNQAEKEIILSTVFTVCYDVFSGFAHFSRSTQQPLGAESLAFLLRSQSLLAICLDDYRAVYDKFCEPQRTAESFATDHTLSAGTKSTDVFSAKLEARCRPTGLMLSGCQVFESLQGTILSKANDTAKTEGTSVDESNDTNLKSKPLHETFVKKYGLKLASASTDIWMGTQLLFVDIMDALQLLLKQLHGHKMSMWQRRKLKRTLNDIATLIPITILMLLPVSAVGHAAMLAAIRRYVPGMIPSPYSSERLGVVKQLDRTKKMEVRSWSKLEDPPSINNLNDSSSAEP